MGNDADPDKPLPGLEDEPLEDEDVPLVPPTAGDDEAETNDDDVPEGDEEGEEEGEDEDEEKEGIRWAQPSHTGVTHQDFYYGAKFFGEEILNALAKARLEESESLPEWVEEQWDGEKREVWRAPDTGTKFVIDRYGVIKDPYDTWVGQFKRPDDPYGSDESLAELSQRQLEEQLITSGVDIEEVQRRTGFSRPLVRVGILLGIGTFGLLFFLFLRNGDGSDTQAQPDAQQPPAAELDAPTGQGDPATSPDADDGAPGAEPTESADEPLTGTDATDSNGSTDAEALTAGSQPTIAGPQEATPETVDVLFGSITPGTTWTLTAEIRAEGDNCTTFVGGIELRFDSADAGSWVFDEEAKAGQEGRPFGVVENRFVVDHVFDGPAGTVEEMWLFNPLSGNGEGKVNFLDVGFLCNYLMSGLTLFTENGRLGMDYGI